MVGLYSGLILLFYIITFHNVYGWKNNCRIKWLKPILQRFIATTTLPFLITSQSCYFPVIAADISSSTILYKSGKSPEGLPIKKSDSKKDITFLRCISDCKTKCQLPGQGIGKVDCIQDCQDQCCNSYEQCSYKIKINNANAL
jgi:hypothetical protein